MARKKRNARPSRRKKQSFMTSHDEDKLLLFTGGLLLGVGLSVSIFLQQWWYGGLVAVALGVVLLLIEQRHE